RLQPVGRLVEGPRVAVAQVENRLPVELVGEETRGSELGVLLRHREGIERWIARGFLILADQPDEGLRRERVGGAQALDLREEQLAAPEHRVVHVEPARAYVAPQIEMVP